MASSTPTTGPSKLEPGGTQQAVGELVTSACRLGLFSACLVMRRDGPRLVEVAPVQGEVELPLADTFSGGCVETVRAQVGHVGEDSLHPRERALLRNAGADYWLGVPVVVNGGATAEGLVVAMKAAPLSAATGLHERTLLGMVAEEVALLWQIDELEQALGAARQHARQLENENEEILQSFRSAALVLTAENRIRAANRAAEALLGFQLATARGRTLDQVLHDREVIEVVSGLHSTWGSDLPEVRLGDDQDQVVEIRITPIFDARGDLQARVVVLKDTTVLRQADELKNQFVSMVSHELRTPLTSIKAFASMLLRCDAPTPEDQREWLRIIDHECDRLTALVNDLLAISKLDSGQPLPTMFAEFDLMALLREVAASQQASANKHTLSVSGPEKLLIDGDSDQLRQVFTNLVHNAVKYSPRGGEVAVAASCDPETCLLRVSIQDQGVGIRPEQVNLVFEKFFQVDGSSTRRVGGTGLGLYLARRLIELHHGRVWVESTLGSGSTFVVELPHRRGAVCRREA